MVIIQVIVWGTQNHFMLTIPPYNTPTYSEIEFYTSTHTESSILQHTER